MLKLIAAIWVAFATLLPVSVALAQDATAKSGRGMIADGVVVAARSWDISAEVSNKISRIHFVQGQIVKKGDLLVEFDSGFKKLDVEVAEVALARADATRPDHDAVHDATYQAELFRLARTLQTST